MRVPFHKMHGAGNDFAIFDGRETSPRLTPAMIRGLADRHRGIGWDQLVLLLPPEGPEEDVRVRFFNTDGSESGTCGNASRCVAALAAGFRPGIALRIGTGGGRLAARTLEGGLVEVSMGRPRLDWQSVPLARDCDTLHLPLPGDPAACSMGNPHITFFLDADGEGADPAEAGPRFERDPLLPERANVGFARIVSRERIRLRVWERGTGLTLACGSGACAAAVNAARRGLVERRVAVEMDGGTVEIAWDEDGEVRMTGPAVLAYRGEIELDQFL